MAIGDPSRGPPTRVGSHTGFGRLLSRNDTLLPKQLISWGKSVDCLGPVSGPANWPGLDGVGSVWMLSELSPSQAGSLRIIRIKRSRLKEAPVEGSLLTEAR